MPSHSLSTLRLEAARSFWRRLTGLMFQRGLPADSGLLISNCPSVHTFFMRFAIDVIYLDGQGRVVKLVPGLRPWRVSVGGRHARQALELAAGGIAAHGIELGDRL